MILAWIVAGFLALSPFLKDEPIQFKVGPAVSSAPAALVVDIRIARHPENRLLQWACEGENLWALREFQLEGENTPATFRDDKTLRMVPEGDYVCYARLFRTDRNYQVKAVFQVR